MADKVGDTAEGSYNGHGQEGLVEQRGSGFAADRLTKPGQASPLCPVAPWLLGPRVQLHAGGLLDAQKYKLE